MSGKHARVESQATIDSTIETALERRRAQGRLRTQRYRERLRAVQSQPTPAQVSQGLQVVQFNATQPNAPTTNPSQGLRLPPNYQFYPDTRQFAQLAPDVRVIVEHNRLYTTPPEPPEPPEPVLSHSTSQTNVTQRVLPQPSFSSLSSEEEEEEDEDSDLDSTTSPIPSIPSARTVSPVPQSPPRPSPDDLDNEPYLNPDSDEHADIVSALSTDTESDNREESPSPSLDSHAESEGGFFASEHNKEKEQELDDNT